MTFSIFRTFHTLFHVCFTQQQDRHPERSASQICRITRGLQREVEGPRRFLLADAIPGFPATNPKKSQAPSEAEGSAVHSTSSQCGKDAPPLPCHPACPGVPWDRSVPGFPGTQNSQRPRMRLSVKKGARPLPKPTKSTGNSGERSGGTCGSTGLSWKTACITSNRVEARRAVTRHQPSPEGLGDRREADPSAVEPALSEVEGCGTIPATPT